PIVVSFYGRAKVDLVRVEVPCSFNFLGPLLPEMLANQARGAVDRISGGDQCFPSKRFREIIGRCTGYCCLSNSSLPAEEEIFQVLLSGYERREGQAQFRCLHGRL